MTKKTETRQVAPISQVSGILFHRKNGHSVAMFGHSILTLNNFGYKCTVTDTRNKSFRGFHSITNAKAFMKRKRHGITYMQHLRAEKLKKWKEEHNLSMIEFSSLLDMSSKTVESYFSGHRVVPEKLIEVLS